MNRFGRIGAISFARKHRLSRAFSLKVHKSSSKFWGGCGGWGWRGRKGERGGSVRIGMEMDITVSTVRTRKTNCLFRRPLTMHA